MTSDRSLAAFARVLGEAGASPPTGRELAELLWLARHVRPAAAPTPPAGDPVPHQAGPARRTPRATPPAPPPAGGAGPARAAPPQRPGGRVQLRTPAAARTTPPAPRPVVRPVEQTSLLAPAPSMLAHPLSVQRALRPFRRTVPSPYARELDETATADRMAALAAPPERWLPVLRPGAERWLHLRLVFDSGPTMAMWRPLLRDLRTALGQTGAFRTVDVVRLGADGRIPSRRWDRARTAVLIVSDAMGPQWRQGAAGLRWYRTLHGWAASMPVAVVQPLPERMWRHTAFPPAAGLLTSPGPGVPDSALTLIPYDTVATAGIPVPVLEPSADWLGNWAALVAAPGGTSVPGAAALLGPRPPRTTDDGRPALAPEDVPPEELVLRFRSLASPEAFRLASYLAVGTAHLPVMRLVQAAVEERPRPQHLAEVVLSGMLKALPGTEGGYVFRPGVRDVLLHTLPRTALARTADLLHRVSAEIEARAGAVPGEFRALVTARGGTPGAAGDPFALVSRESVRLLRGPETVGVSRREAAAAVLGDRYELAELLGRGSMSAVWRARDTWSHREVVIKVFGPVGNQGDSTAKALFVSDTSTVIGYHGRSLELVHDAFVNGDYCVMVSERTRGRPLRETIPQGGLPETALRRLAEDLSSALATLHGARLVHGNLNPANVLVLPSDALIRLVLCDYAVRWPHPGPPRPRSREEDLLALGRVLFEAATGSAPPADGPTRGSLRELRPDLSESLEHAVDSLCGHGDREEQDQAHRSFLRRPRLPAERNWTKRWEYRVLGAPVALIDGEDRSAESFRPGETLLLRLLMARGRPVPYNELVREPRDVSTSARALRELGHAIEYSERTGTAQQLPLRDATFDLVEAERLAAAAEQAGRLGDRAGSRALYRQALGLWAGTPLDGVEGRWAAEQRTALRELRDSYQRAYDGLGQDPPAPDRGLLFVEVLPYGSTDLEGMEGAVLNEVLAAMADESADHAVRSAPTPRTALVDVTGSDPGRLVDWLTDVLPGLLVRHLPDFTGTARLSVVLHRGGTVEEQLALRRTAAGLAAVAHLEEQPAVVVFVLPDGDDEARDGHRSGVAFRTLQQGPVTSAASAPPRPAWLSRLGRYLRSDPKDEGRGADRLPAKDKDGDTGPHPSKDKGRDTGPHPSPDDDPFTSA